LVADVVTGKLDVRKAAEGLPDIDEGVIGSAGEGWGLESEEEEELEEEVNP
jgi:hypothetical protein